MVLTNSSLRPTRSANETLFTLDVVQVGPESLASPFIFIAVRLADNCHEGCQEKSTLCYNDFVRHAYL